jgi:CheY-like chemotaxis protein
VHRDNFLCIAVHDTSHGMPPHAIGSLFESFFATSEGDAAKGVGLAAARTAVSNLGGFLSVDSKPGRGTTIEMFLPAAPAAAGGTDWPTVLLVEDDEARRRILHNFLEAHDYNLLEAADAEDALALAEMFAGTIDLLVTDAARDGLAEKLKTVRPAMKVLFAAESGKDPAVTGAGETRIMKPIRKIELLEKIQEMLR